MGLHAQREPVRRIAVMAKVVAGNGDRPIIAVMSVLRARVQGGKLVLNEPTDLPEGTNVQLVVVDDDSGELSPEERAAVEASLDRSLDQVDRGEVIPAAEALRRARGE